MSREGDAGAPVWLVPERVQVVFFPELSIIDPGGMDPQEHYCRVILPLRLDMDLEYIRRQSFWFDLGLIFRTIGLILFKAPLLALGVKFDPVPIEAFKTRV